MHLKHPEKKLIVISGPTGIGKTQLALDAAAKLNTVIISADSRQIYKQMDIGTAKPSKNQIQSIPHYLIDLIDPDKDYSAGQFERDGLALLQQLFKKHDTILLVGGTGLYIKALCEGLDNFPEVKKETSIQLNDIFEKEGITILQQMLLDSDPEYYSMVDLKNHRRLIRALAVIKTSGKKYSDFLQKKAKERNFAIHYVFLKAAREELYNRINNRVDEMIRSGLEDEVRKLVKYRGAKSLESVGYQEMFKFFDGEWTIDYAIDKIKQHTRNYAKRQMTWLRKTENAHWFDTKEIQNALAFILNTGFTKDPALSQEVDQ